jgi:hypothetical protein
MKYFITVFLLLFAFSSRAQITLEHTYTNTTEGGFYLAEVDSAVWKYVITNLQDSISIYNLDHSLERVVIIPTDEYSGIEVIAKHLFDLDSSYQILLQSYHAQGIRVFKDDGTLLFSCDQCSLGAVPYTGGSYGAVSGIKSTPNGTKMVVGRGNVDTKVEVYSLPGKLPTCSTTPLSAVNSSTAYTNPTLPTSAYPNPTSGQVRIAYELPSGVSSGDLILTAEDGREVKRYRVTSAFSDLLIEPSDLSSGSYFYKLVTEKGESQSQRIVMTK